MSKHNANNHSNQLNPNNPAYWSSRGVPTPAAPASNPPPQAPAVPAAPAQTENK